MRLWILAGPRRTERIGKRRRKSHSPNFAGVGGIGLVIGIAGFVLLVLYTGMIALLISAHDRFCDVVAIMDRRNELLEMMHGDGSGKSSAKIQTVAD